MPCAAVAHKTSHFLLAQYYWDQLTEGSVHAHICQLLTHYRTPDPSADQIPRLLGQLKWTLTQDYWASKSQLGYLTVLDQLTVHQISKNVGWAEDIGYPRLMGGLMLSDTQHYWMSWRYIGYPRMLGGLGVSDTQECWVGWWYRIPNIIGWADSTLDIQERWVGWGYRISKNVGWAEGIGYPRMMGGLTISDTQHY